VSYHDLHITTDRIERTSIFDLPFRVYVTCNRVAGWEVWALQEDSLPEELLGGEYGGEGRGLRLDVAGHVIVDSLTKAEAEPSEAVE
jgi:hypothetical protein